MAIEENKRAYITPLNEDMTKYRFIKDILKSKLEEIRKKYNGKIEEYIPNISEILQGYNN